MKLKIVTLCVLSNLFLIPDSFSQSVWDIKHLSDVKLSIQEPFYANSYQALKTEAENLLRAQPLSVIMKDKVPASGDKHDYMSQARYAWPDPSKTNGLPYITKDGMTNPEINQLDRNRLGVTAHRITILSLAWYFSNNEEYAQKATELIRIWFLDKETRMNPNLEYAQMVPGHNNDKGRCYGLIDTYSFIEMLDAIMLLESSKAFTKKDSKQLKKWFTQLTNWMLTSPQGKEESNGTNNHSVAYDAQIIAFALYTGNEKLAKQIIHDLPEKRIYTQIEPDGRQPQELRRTLAFHYSQYNLSHFIDIMLMAKKLNCNIDLISSSDGRSFYKAMDFLASYIGKKQSKWPYQQISGWDESQQNFCQELYRTYKYLNPDRKDYLKLYNTYRIFSPDDYFNLLYVQPTEVDNAYAAASNQLTYAMKCADKARKEEKNAAKRRVTPRSINKDGSLALVGANDWCSGFFAGSLWQMYAYTHSNFWRQQAISWTWPIEEAKWNKGTHDLGFMIYGSFGKAYELTNEYSYRDVVLQASKSLISRYNPTVKCIRSWDHNRDKWNYPVIIDNMMNLEMLFRATQLTGDSIYWKIAVNHANTTLKNHFRSDYSSYHVVDYNPQTGEVQTKCKHQGYSDDSFWSRGQAWGLYGFTMCYRFTKDPTYLAQSEHIADFFLNLPNMPEDFIPYWDMKAPEIAGLHTSQAVENVPRDASAAAIIASGLYELSTYVNAKKQKQYIAIADKIVHNLYKNYRTEPNSHFGFLLLHSTGHHPGGSEIDVPINYADYYYLEALARKQALDNQ